jgi:hypothetical protein
MRRAMSGLAPTFVVLALTLSFGDVVATEDESPATAGAAASVTPEPSFTGAASSPAARTPLLVDAICTAVDELFTAVGNPDTGEASLLSRDLEDAIVAGDATLIDTTTTAILAHLEASRSAAARAASYPPAAAGLSAFDEFLTIVAEGVVAKRDAAPDGLEASRAAAQRTWDRAVAPWRAWLTELGPIWFEIAGDRPMPCPSPPD